MSDLGNLEDLRLAEVVRVLAKGRNTGLVSVQDGARQAQIQLVRGRIVHAEAGRSRGRDAVLEACGWRSGRIVFVVGEHSLVQNVDEDSVALLDEGERVGEALHRLQQVITSDRLVFQWGPGPEDGEMRLPVGRREWRVLREVDGIREVREIVEASGFVRLDVLDVLYEFVQAGFLERTEIPKALKIQAPGLRNREEVAVDDAHLVDWQRNRRFASGVFRVEVRAGTGSHVATAVTLRPGLGDVITLPRALMAELRAQEGDEVYVRPLS